MSVTTKTLLPLLWVFLVHLTGIYLFTSGFLLSRLALPNFSTCIQEPCSTPPTHSRAVILIIDALRFDFISPTPPVPTSAFHHNVLTLPQQLTTADPSRSFIFNAYADPPTTTLQRIKGITTGSLPTFMDIGSNFGASDIQEDSLINRLKIAGKTLAFMGDDTWMSVFPDSFHPNLTFPYDSFNVEDLHTVDEGVITHLFPLLEDASKPFDVLIGHFLGVDHVGHRLGPDHPTMKSKLEQMNSVLARVVELLDDDALLVVLGDHGMDRSGDHGGDGELETSAGVWIYSKGAKLVEGTPSIPETLASHSMFPGTTVSHRQIQQIDLVPTLSLLLGLPIPFNNLGTVIPELFWRGNQGDALFIQALEHNALQVREYLKTYRESASGNELDDAWMNISEAWGQAQNHADPPLQRAERLYKYNRLALESCRFLWAQFNQLRMACGLSLLLLGSLATWAIYQGLRAETHHWDRWVSRALPWALRGGAIGTIVGFVGCSVLQSYLPDMDALDSLLFFTPFFSCIAVIYVSRPNISLRAFWCLPIPLVLHSISFFSNSFTFWEDRIAPFLAVSSIAPSVMIGLTAPTSRLRYRILGFCALYAICIRLMSMSTVCREEQQPYCHVTFYSSATLPSPPLVALLMSIPLAISLPHIMKRFLRISKSDSGIAPLFLRWLLTPILLAGTAVWTLEWMESADILGNEWTYLLRSGRTVSAWLAVAVSVVAFVLYWSHPLCLDINMVSKDGGETKELQVIGYANAFGAPYLLFWSISFGLTYLTTQLTGQLVLGCTVVSLFSYLEIVDSIRDVRTFEAAFASSTPSAALNSNNRGTSAVTFTEVIPLALLGISSFYGTGHQSTISSIQWKSAFLLTSTLQYPFSPATVIVNSFGPIFIIGVAAPLLALWNRTPLPIKQKNFRPDTQIRGESILAGLGMMLYYSCLLCGTAISAAVLRRHLMVWKVFAPRFMTAAIGLLVTDIAVLVGVGVGAGRVGSTVSQLVRALQRGKPDKAD